MSDNKFEEIYSELTDRIISAAIDVHRELGCGLKEEAYEAVLAWELGQRGYKVERQVPCPVVYKGLKEGLEHVDNFKATNSPILPDSHPPSSESNLDSFSPQTPPNLLHSSSPSSESNITAFFPPDLQHSSSPSSESNPTPTP